MQTLLYVGNETSIGPLQKLIEIENESKYVEGIANAVLYKIVNSKELIMIDTIMYIGDVNRGNAQGSGRMYYKYNGKLIYEGGFRDNRFHGNGIYYNDNGTVKYKGRFVDGKYMGR